MRRSRVECYRLTSAMDSRLQEDCDDKKLAVEPDIDGSIISSNCRHTGGEEKRNTIE